MALPVTTPLRSILTAIQAQIAVGTGLDPTRILLVTKRVTPKLLGGQDCLIRVGPVQPEPGYDASVGRLACITYRKLDITIRTEYGVDVQDRSDLWVTDSTLGHYVAEENLISCLDNYQPTDPSNNVLLQEPMHWLPSSGAEQDPKDVVWGQTTQSFSILYQLPMSRTI